MTKPTKTVKPSTMIRFKTHADFERVRRAARLQDVSMNKFITRAAVKAAEADLAEAVEQEADEAQQGR